MTGYGSGSRTDAQRSVKVEARAVNHRFSDIVLRLPKGYQALEERLRKVAAEYVQRGRVEIFLTVEEFGANERTVRLDQGLLKGYLEAFSAAAALLDTQASPDVETLLRLPGVLSVDEVDVDLDAAWPVIEEALREALSELTRMRRSEGERLYADIVHRLSKVEQIIGQMAAKAPLVVEEYKNRLAERIQEWMADGPLDESRLAMEVAFFADKASIDEELTRATSHISEFRKVCLTEGSVGRKLDFLLQELQREINTIASKAHDVQIAGWVVECKAEIEKIREQIQNIE